MWMCFTVVEVLFNSQYATLCEISHTCVDEEKYQCLDKNKQTKENT